MRDRDFEDEWEDIGRYLLSTGWAVKERMRGRGQQEKWEYKARNSGLGLTGGLRGFVRVHGYPDAPPSKVFLVYLSFPIVDERRTRRLGEEVRHRQQDVFLAALSDLFDGVEAVQREANSPLYIDFPTISSLPGSGWVFIVEGTWSMNRCEFKDIPSAEDAIGNIEAFVLTQREMR